MVMDTVGQDFPFLVADHYVTLRHDWTPLDIARLPSLGLEFLWSSAATSTCVKQDSTEQDGNYEDLAQMLVALL